MKKTIDKQALIYPKPIVIVGILQNDSPCYFATTSVSIISHKPALIAMVIEPNQPFSQAFTMDSRFSINLPSSTWIDRVDLALNWQSLNHLDQPNLFETTTQKTTVPYIVDAKVALIVKISNVTDIGKRKLLIADVQKTIVDDSIFIDNVNPSLNILDPIIYGIDNKYYAIGQVLGSRQKESEKLYQNLRKHQKPKPYNYYFKLKICQLKEVGSTYKELAEQFDVYSETIEDWYMLYRIFGSAGLTRKMAIKLANTPFTETEQVALAQQIIARKATYKSLIETHYVSLSRLRNWVKKARRNEKGS